MQFVAIIWACVGVWGGQMLSYPGDGFNFRHVLGGLLGPVTLLVAALDVTRPEA